MPAYLGMTHRRHKALRLRAFAQRMRNPFVTARDGPPMTDLHPLAKMKKLEVLLMKRTRVQDVSPLKDLTSLKHLYIEGSAVKDVSALSGIRGLKIHEGS